MRMRFSIKTVSVILVVSLAVSLGCLAWFFYQKYFSTVKDSINRQIYTPGPLEVQDENDQAYLTRSGIIDWTNKERSKHGLARLNENDRLNRSAQLKVTDMFKEQYFAHNSPTGESVADLADDVNYNYLIIGENLALGNFIDDQALVKAWMDSPGHRANILKESYTQIGVAVFQGYYQGRRSWMAVQHFATPQSICSAPNESLKDQIEDNQEKINLLKDQIIQLKAEINQAGRKNRVIINC